MNPYPSYSDQQLVSLLKISDESAFNEIYERYWELLFGMAFNRLKQLAEAEDVVHDVFASLWKRKSEQEISSLKSYLAVSLKYTVLRIIYRKKLFAVFSSDDHSERIICNEKRFEDREMLLQVRKQLAILPERCRIIFQMSRLDGLSNAQIAEELNITGKTVENQINKAQNRLRLSVKNFNSFLSILFSGLF